MGTSQELYRVRRDTEAALLASVRPLLLQLVEEGDIGEDHTALFLHDHPQVRERVQGLHLPFARFCKRALEITDPLQLLGFVLRNEVGSVAEARALLRLKFIQKGEFSRIHCIEEPEHGRLALQVQERLQEEPLLYRRLAAGFDRHDQIYRSIMEV